VKGSLVVYKKRFQNSPHFFIQNAKPIAPAK